MSKDIKTAVRLTLDDQYSAGVNEATEKTENLGKQTEKTAKTADKEVSKASRTTKQFGESAHNAGNKAASGFRAAGSAVRNFADGAKTAVGLIDKAYSGTGAALATLGVSFSVGSAVNEVIKFDDKLTRIGLTADASAEQIKNLKDKIFDAALNSDIKVDTTSIADALDVVMTKTGDLAYSEANIKNIATAIKATGESGEAIGSVFAEFAKFGYTAEQITDLMDDMVKQGDQGAFTFGEFAKAGAAVISAYSPIGTAPEDIKRANAAMQILTAGMKDPTAAVTALQSLMSDLGNPDKQAKLKLYGVNVRDEVTGAFRDLGDIMHDVNGLIDQMGNSDQLHDIFGDVSIRGVNAFYNFYDKMYDNLVNLGDTQGALSDKAATMAGTLASNLKNLQTAFVRFADTNLTKPLEKLTDLLNSLAENKAVYQGIFTGLATLAGAVGTIKIASGVRSFVTDFLKLKNGGGTNINIGSNIGGQGMPVYVTNWGGQAGSATATNTQTGQNTVPAQVGSSAKGFKGKLATAGSAAKSAAPKAAGAAAVFAALEAVPQAAAEIAMANEDEALSNKQKGKAKGGAVGAAAGKIGGAAAGAAMGAAAGAAIGTVVPVVGNIVGGLLGAVIGGVGGYFGGKGGRILGEKIGEGLAKDDSAVVDTVLEETQQELPNGGIASALPPPPENQYMTGNPQWRDIRTFDFPAGQLPPEITEQYISEAPQYTGATAKLDGAIEMKLDVEVKNNSVSVNSEVTRNTTGGRVMPELGSAKTARDML